MKREGGEREREREKNVSGLFAMNMPLDYKNNDSKAKNNLWPKQEFNEIIVRKNIDMVFRGDDSRQKNKSPFGGCACMCIAKFHLPSDTFLY